VRRFNKAALDHAMYAPLGSYLRYHALAKECQASSGFARAS